MDVLILYKLKTIILKKLRHSWTFITFVAKLIDSYYRKAINRLQELPNYNNNNQRIKRPLYNFKTCRLVKCSFKEKHCTGGFPLPLHAHRMIASKSHLYSLGGYNSRSGLAIARRGRCRLFQELWSFNFATNRWKLELNADNADNMPNGFTSNALVIHNDVLFSLGGGRSFFGESSSNDCYVYRPSNDKLAVEHLKVSGDMPTANGPGLVIHKHYLYTIGGSTRTNSSCDVYRLDLRTKIWQSVYICRPEMGDDPIGRHSHEVVYDGKHIFVLGGATLNSAFDLKRILAYNLDTNSWDYFDTLPDRNSKRYPKPRNCFSCVQHTLSNGDIEAFITGGRQGLLSKFLSDIWKLNLRTKQWTIIQTARLPRPSYYHAAAHSDNGCMYIFGGLEYCEIENRRRNVIYKMWMTIPKLSEMCWDAITYYNDNLDLFNRKSLLTAGIPKSFTDRLPPQRAVGDKNKTSTSLYSIAKRA